MAIWQDLVDDHGFVARYASVRRFVVALRGAAPPDARAVITTAPGEEGQVDYGATPTPPTRSRTRTGSPTSSRSPAPADPVRPHLHLRPDGQGPAPGLGAVRRHVRDLDLARHGLEMATGRSTLGTRTSSALGAGRRQHGGQGGPLRPRGIAACSPRRRPAPRTDPSTPCTTASRRSAAWCRCRHDARRGRARAASASGSTAARSSPCSPCSSPG